MTKEDERTNFRCDALARALLAPLTRFGITGVVCGMGAWCLRMSTYVGIDADGDARVWDRHDAMDWRDELNNRPHDITQEELNALEDLHELCDWWVEETGGRDVLLPQAKEEPT